MIFSRVEQYCYLMRLHKPIGIFLLLWPTLWALWLASHHHPDVKITLIFILGVVMMRAAGCIINDFADRHYDGYVARTRERPLVTGKVSRKEALILFIILLSTAFLLVLQLNRLAIQLSFIGATLAIVYPFMKRFTHWPQFGLGLAFAWGVPMAFAAELSAVTIQGWLVFLVAVVWPIIYDTMYAMVDQADDVKIGVKSTAILFGQQARIFLLVLQVLFLLLLILMGYVFQLSHYYFLSLIFVFLLCCYQQWLIRNHEPPACFEAFLNNNWVGCVIFIGILA